MALLTAHQLAGPGFIILNVMRAMNIIALASVVASSVVMLVKTFIVSKFFFFDATSHVITGVVGLFLIVSECSLFRTYFARHWPLLSPSHGFVSLGCAMMVLGLNMLGNMNKEATSQKSLGMPFWRLLVASGILCFVIGVFNIVASYVFRDSSRNITARLVRSRGAMTLHDTPEDVEAEVNSKLAFTITTHHTGSSTSRTGSPPLRMGTPPVDCGSPQLTTASPQKEESGEPFSPLRALRNARQSILPSYHSTSPTKNTLFPFHHRRSSSVYSRSTSGGEPLKKKFWQRQQQRDSDVPRMPEISAPMNVNPQFAHLVRPNLAHHPSQRRPEADFDKI